MEKVRVCHCGFMMAAGAEVPVIDLGVWYQFTGEACEKCGRELFWRLLEGSSGCLLVTAEYAVGADDKVNAADDYLDALLRAGFRWGEHIPRDCVILEVEW